MAITLIPAPLVNPNEPEAILQAIHIANGQPVAQGDVLCTLETTKSTLEVEAPRAGFVVGWRFEKGQAVPAGETLCTIADTADESPADEADGAAPAAPADRRFTKPALSLARQHALDLEHFPAGALVTEAMVRDAIQKSRVKDLQIPPSAFDPTAILVYGGGGHGKALIELLRAQAAYRIVGLVDDGKQRGEQVTGVPVLGGSEILAELYSQGVRLAANAVGGIGNIAARIAVFRRLAEAGFTCPALVHPTAYLEPSARLAPGVQVMPHAYVGSEAVIGFGALINTGVIVSHDCTLGEYANLSPGAILAGEVQVGERALVGMGVTVNLQVQIGAGARIGNGATIKSDVPENAVVRAGSTWPD